MVYQLMPTFSRDEVEREFRRYVERGGTNDWSAWADQFTEDALYVERALGTFHAREEVRLAPRMAGAWRSLGQVLKDRATAASLARARPSRPAHSHYCLGFCDGIKDGHQVGCFPIFLTVPSE